MSVFKVEGSPKLRRYTRQRLFAVDAPLCPAQFGRTQIERLVPHRDPFLLVDDIKGFNIKEGLIVGRYTVRRDDPIFHGHFPGNPVFPGTLLMEMLGQVGIALLTLIKNGGVLPEEDLAPPAAFVIKVEGAYFVSPVRPGDEVTLLAQSSGWNDLLAGMIGQALVGDRICCVVSGQVCK